MTRDAHYRVKSLKELIDGYAFEIGRKNQQERESTKKAIVLEVYARIKDTFDMLDANPESAEQVYRQLIGCSGGKEEIFNHLNGDG